MGKKIKKIIKGIVLGFVILVSIACIIVFSNYLILMGGAF